MAIYETMWNTIVSSTAERQPILELRRPKEKAASARVTIMLDYRSYPTFYNWAMAFRDRHHLICFAMLLSLILSVAVIPLTAHLFISASSHSASTVPLSFPTIFNESALTSRSSLQPAIDLATAIRVYGGNPPSWMTTDHSRISLG